MLGKKQKLSTEAYKGTRDFYPEDLAVQKFIFKTTRQVAEKFGYEEYNAPLLEPTELYTAKSGEEIINEQTYSFQDRGERNVTLRPEMTPSVARMVAQRKRELAYPLRWYSLQNFFRYERPQKGRLREFWQLNADIFGVTGIEAEVEIISLGYEIMKSLGAQDKDFVIKINYAGLLKKILEEDLDLKLTGEEVLKTIKTIDRKNKISTEEFETRLIKEIGEDRGQKLIKKLENEISERVQQNVNFNKCIELSKKLSNKGIPTELDPQLTRGFDYYTGIVFEFFDTNPDNKRSLFGGGRYDDLLSLFGEDSIPAVGLGMGDVTLLNFLGTRNLLPVYQSTTKLYLCPLTTQYLSNADQLADQLRQQGLTVAVDYSGKKIGDQIATADKKKIPYILCLGENEVQTQQYKLKNLQTGEETDLPEKTIADFLKNK